MFFMPSPSCSYLPPSSGRTLEETAALFDGEPVELVEAAGEAATHHTALYFVGRDSREHDDSVEDSANHSDIMTSKRPPSGERKEPIEMYEDIEMRSVSIANTDSRGEILEPSSPRRTKDESKKSFGGSYF
jgi:hypothetical protein